MLVEGLFLSPFVQMKTVTAHLVSTKNFLKPELSHGRAVFALWVNSPTSLVPPFLLTWNLSPKTVAEVCNTGIWLLQHLSCVEEIQYVQCTQEIAPHSVVKWSDSG